MRFPEIFKNFGCLSKQKPTKPPFRDANFVYSTNKKYFRYLSFMQQQWETLQPTDRDVGMGKLLLLISFNYTLRLAIYGGEVLAPEIINFIGNLTDRQTD